MAALEEERTAALSDAVVESSAIAGVLCDLLSEAAEDDAAPAQEAIVFFEKLAATRAAKKRELAAVQPEAAAKQAPAEASTARQREPAPEDEQRDPKKARQDEAADMDQDEAWELSGAEPSEGDAKELEEDLLRSLGLETGSEEAAATLRVFRQHLEKTAKNTAIGLRTRITGKAGVLKKNLKQHS